MKKVNLWVNSNRFLIDIKCLSCTENQKYSEIALGFPIYVNINLNLYFLIEYTKFKILFLQKIKLLLMITSKDYSNLNLLKSNFFIGLVETLYLCDLQKVVSF